MRIGKPIKKYDIVPAEFPVLAPAEPEPIMVPAEPEKEPVPAK